MKNKMAPNSFGVSISHEGFPTLSAVHCYDHRKNVASFTLPEVASGESRIANCINPEELLSSRHNKSDWNLINQEPSKCQESLSPQTFPQNSIKQNNCVAQSPMDIQSPQPSPNHINGKQQIHFPPHQPTYTLPPYHQNYINIHQPVGMNTSNTDWNSHISPGNVERRIPSGNYSAGNHFPNQTGNKQHSPQVTEKHPNHHRFDNVFQNISPQLHPNNITTPVGQCVSCQRGVHTDNSSVSVHLVCSECQQINTANFHNMNPMNVHHQRNEDEIRKEALRQAAQIQRRKLQHYEFMKQHQENINSLFFQNGLQTNPDPAHQSGKSIQQDHRKSSQDSGQTNPDPRPPNQDVRHPFQDLGGANHVVRESENQPVGDNITEQTIQKEVEVDMRLIGDLPPPSPPPVSSASPSSIQPAVSLHVPSTTNTQSTSLCVPIVSTIDDNDVDTKPPIPFVSATNLRSGIGNKFLRIDLTSDTPSPSQDQTCDDLLSIKDGAESVKSAPGVVEHNEVSVVNNEENCNDIPNSILDTPFPETLPEIFSGFDDEAFQAFLSSSTNSRKRKSSFNMNPESDL